MRPVYVIIGDIVDLDPELELFLEDIRVGSSEAEPDAEEVWQEVLRQRIQPVLVEHPRRDEMQAVLDQES